MHRSRLAGSQRFYGWRPSLPDWRDKRFSADNAVMAALPEQVDLATPALPAPFEPTWNQGNIGSCFPAGTMIRRADGSEVPIIDIRLGDEVVTAEGRTGVVRQLMMRPHDDGLVCVCLWGRSALRMTAEHPVFTRRGYVTAAELTLSDYVAMPRYRPVEVFELLQTAALISRREALVKVGQRKMGVFPGRAETVITVSTVPETIALTPRFGRLVGLFLAEGSTDSARARWTFGAHEKDTLVAEAVDLLGDLGVEAHIQPRAHNSINVVIHGTAWARLWERLCGNGAGGKSAHPLLLSGSDAFLEAMLMGWLAGDGHYARHKTCASTRNRGKSVSKALALCMYDIAQHLGLRPAFRLEKATPSGKVKSRRDVHIVELNSHNADACRWSEQTDTHVFRKVRAIEQEPFEGFVYNMTVEGDNSYVAEGVGVHNCGPHSAAGDMVFAGYRQQSMASVVMPSRLFIYYCARTIMGTVNEDSGVDNRSLMQALAKYGWCDETMWPYVPNRFRERPPQACFDAAVSRRITDYLSVPQNLDQMKGCLAGGDGFIFGFTLYESFESPSVSKTGIVPMPGRRERIAGGHDVMIVGYNDSTRRFKFRNSWGDWGDFGYGTIPYEYATNPQLSGDFWTARVSGLTPPPKPPDPPIEPPIDPLPPVEGTRTLVFIGPATLDGKPI